MYEYLLLFDIFRIIKYIFGFLVDILRKKCYIEAEINTIYFNLKIFKLIKRGERYEKSWNCYG